MMKLTTVQIFSLLLALQVLCSIRAIAQSNVDSINSWVEKRLGSTADSSELLKNAHLSLNLSRRYNNESGRIKAYINLAKYYEQYGQLDSVIYYYTMLKKIYKENNMMEALADICIELKVQYGGKADYAEAMKQLYEALEIYESLGNQKGIAICYTHICDLLYYEDKYEESANYCDKAIAIQQEIDAKTDLAISYRYKASSVLFIDGRLEDALETINKAISIYHELGETGLPLWASLNGRGNILKYMARFDEAISDYQFIYEKVLEAGMDGYAIPPLANIGHVYLMQNKYEKALPNFLEAIDLMIKTGNTKNLWENYMHVSECYKQLGNFEKAYSYQALQADEREKYLNSIIDRLESEAQIKYETAEKDKMIRLQENKIAYQKRTQLLYLGIAVILIVSLIGMIRSRLNIRRKQKLIEHSREELQRSLENLKATQSQLLHAEKMASLGELTAGIAHEIQNPLNFVNNFSEVSVDLIDDLNEEVDNGETVEIKALAGDLKQNLEKILHHGKRASGIVKGMLEHSRASSGEKTPTDLNALADEYLRLAFHGLRAKDKSFHSDFKTDFDPDLPKVNVVPQDMGRVLLNLINNAFYVVNEKSKGGDAGYKPMVSVSTKRVGYPSEAGGNKEEFVQIIVADNGPGIPDEIKDKIFQPFFTTKPSGEGTGLGLSLSYDIITKGHRGTLSVNTEAAKGTEFIIRLPLSNQQTK